MVQYVAKGTRHPDDVGGWGATWEPRTSTFKWKDTVRLSRIFIFSLLLSLSIARDDDDDDDDDVWIERSPLRTEKWREEIKNLSGRGRVDAKVRREIRGRKCVRLVFLRPN